MQVFDCQIDNWLALNSVYQSLDACLTGGALGYLPETLVKHHVSDGRLVRVLEDWCPAFPGFHLYYPSRLQSSPAMGDATNALNNAMSSHNMDAKGRDLAKGLVGMK